MYPLAALWMQSWQAAMAPMARAFAAHAGGLHMPLSGDVIQDIDPVTSWFTNANFSMFNIVVGKPGNPAVERTVLEEVGSYGRQIGRMADALEAVIATLDPKTLTPQQHHALEEFRLQLDAVREVKARVRKRSRQPASLPPAEMPGTS